MLLKKLSGFIDVLVICDVSSVNKITFRSVISSDQKISSPNSLCYILNQLFYFDIATFDEKIILPEKGGDSTAVGTLTTLNKRKLVYVKKDGNVKIKLKY